MDTSPSAASADDRLPTHTMRVFDAGPRKLRACLNCARLKMKCRWPEGTENPEACNRCGRMRIPCTVPPTIARKKRGKSTRVAQLEQKIDGIVSLLTASQQQLQQQSPPSSASVNPAISTSSRPPVLEAVNPSVSVTLTSPSRTIEDDSPPTETFTVSLPKPRSPSRSALSSLLIDTTPSRSPEDLIPPRPDVSIPEVVPGFEMTFKRADEILELYRKRFCVTFPFVQIPQTMTSHALHTSKPILFWTIMHVVAAQTPATQLAMKDWFNRTMAERIVVKGERTLEIVQAMVVYLGWCDLTMFIEHHLTSLLHLSISVLSDLNLNRVPGTVGVAPHTLLGDAWLASRRPSSNRQQHHSYDEMRATLGVFFICSMTSTIGKRNHEFHFTTYLDQCIDLIRRRPESDMDAHLVAMVRIQKMAERIYTILPNPEVDDFSDIEFRSPIDIAVMSIHRELDSVYQSFDEVVKTSYSILPHYHIICARLYEPVISMACPDISLAAPTCNAPFRRTEMLWTCLQKITEFFTAWFAIPIEVYAVSPFSTTAYMTFCMIIGIKLLIGENFPDWNSSLARAQLDFLRTVEKVSQRLEEADVVVQNLGLRRRFLPDGSPAVNKHTFKFKWLCRWYAAKSKGTSHLEMAELKNAFHMEFGFDQDFWGEVMASDGIQGSTGQKKTR